MKYIYKIIPFAILTFALTGCNVDDDDPVTVAEKRSLEASLGVQTEIIAIDDNLTSYELVVNFSEALPSYSSIEYTVDGELGSVSGNTGDTSVSIPLNFEVGVNFRDVSIVGFHVVNADARNILPSISGLTTTKVMKQGTVISTLTWEGTANLDFYFDVMTPTWNWAFVTLDVSSGSTNEETVSAIIDDGNYAFWISTNGAPADYPYVITVTTATGTQSFNGTVTGNSWNLWFTKSTNASGAVSYTFYTEDPA